MTTIRTLFYCAVLGLLLWLAGQAPGRLALAHADLDRSDPAADAVLTTAPTQVQLWFTQELFRRQGENFIEVYAADGSRQDQGEAVINDDDRTLLTVALPPDLPPGVYTVRWQALSAEDGHDSSGEFTFTVGTEGAAATVITDTVITDTVITDTTTPAVATPTIAPTLVATATLPAATATVAPAPAATQASSTGTGLPCLGGAAPLLMAVGALWAGRRRGLLLDETA